MDIPHRRKKDLVFYIFDWCCDVWNNIWLLQKFKNQPRPFFQDFYLWKGVFGCRNPKWIDQKFRNKSFWIFDLSVALKSLCLELFSFVPEKLPVDQKNSLFVEWDVLGSLSLCGISSALNATATKPENPMLRVLLSIQKTLFQKFRSSRFGWRTQKSSAWDKNPGRMHLTFFVFSQRSDVGSIITVTE